MKKILSTFSLVIAAFILLSGTASAATQYKAGTTGIDASYPNCSLKMPAATFGIIGVSDATGYTENPCLPKEARHYKNLSLYVFTGWDAQSSHINPSSPKTCAPRDEDCLAYNYGYNAGAYAYAYAKREGAAHAKSWWLDVEASASWATAADQNQNSLQGEYDFLTAHGKTVGVYSTTEQWDSITGNWLNNWPSWGATTWKTAKKAKTYCTGHEFTDGPSLLMQYRPKRALLDHDVAC